MRGGLSDDSSGDAAAPALTGDTLSAIHQALVAAAEALPPDHPARARIDRGLAATDRLARVPLSQLLHYLRATARTAAASAGLDEPSVDVRIDDVAVPREVHAALQTALPHLIRNAVVHGLETAEVRLAAGKPSAGVITVEAHADGADLRLTVRDDGRGIDRATLADKLREIGGDPDAASLADLIFHPGTSTRDGADLDAGRGMGALAARDAILAVGGALDVASEPGHGTTFVAVVPLNR